MSELTEFLSQAGSLPSADQLINHTIGICVLWRVDLPKVGLCYDYKIEAADEKCFESLAKRLDLDALLFQ